MSEQQQAAPGPLSEEIVQTGPPPAPLTPEQIAARKQQEEEFSQEIKRIAKEEKEKAQKITFDLLSAIHETERHGFASRLVETRLAVDLFDNDSRLAKVFAYSGLFSDIKGVTEQQAIAQALTKIRMGRSWGMNEADSMQFIYFISGKPYVATEMIAAKLMEAGWEWDIRWHLNQQNKNCEGCTLYPKHLRPDGGYDYLMERDPNDPTGKTFRPVEVSFTKADADRAWVSERGKQIQLSTKWNFVSWPFDMYFSRCIGRFKKRHAPNIMRGATPRDEAGDFDDQSEQRQIEPAAAGPAASEQRTPEDRRRGFAGLSGEDIIRRRLAEELGTALGRSPTEDEVERAFKDEPILAIVAKDKASRRAQSGESPQRPAADNPATRQQQEPAQSEGLTQAATTINKIADEAAGVVQDQPIKCSCTDKNWDPTCGVHPNTTAWQETFQNRGQDPWTDQDDQRVAAAQASSSVPRTAKKFEFGRRPK